MIRNHPISDSFSVSLTSNRRIYLLQTNHYASSILPMPVRPTSTIRLPMRYALSPPRGIKTLLMAQTILLQPVKRINLLTLNAQREAEKFIFLRENLFPPM